MWSDRETDRDCLGFQSYVDVLSNICIEPELAPLTLGIFGLWGSGKTSLMQMIRAQIDQAGKPDVKTLWFNAWRYEGREEAQSALINAIIARLEKDSTLKDEGRALWNEAKDAVSKVRSSSTILKAGRFLTKGLVTIAPGLEPLTKLLGDESEKFAAAIDTFEEDFAALLKKLEVTRVVVFIDDLDRCSSAKVIETFETIKLFLNTPACTFVIGADAGKIERAVGEVYSDSDTRRQRDYLEKIVQIPFTIPEQSLRDIACYIGMLIVGRRLREGTWPELIKARPGFYDEKQPVHDQINQWVRDNERLFDGRRDDTLSEIAEVVPFVNILARGLRGNPRQIKRFLNILSLRRQLAKANSLELPPDFIIKIGVLEYVWPDFFQDVSETLDPDNGTSPLIAEMLKARKASAEPESKLVDESIRVPGLIEFLSDEPAINDATDWRPYMFLAQTSLGRGKRPTINTAEETANSLARFIASDDRLRSMAAARRAANLEPALAAAVVRMLLSELQQSPGNAAATHIVTGLQAICSKHTDQFVPCVRALAEFDHGKNAAVALAAVTFLAAAEKAGVRDAPELSKRFKESSSLVKAIAPPPRKGRA